MQHAQAVAEIHAAVLEWHSVERGEMKARVRQPLQPAAGNGECIGAGVDAMQMPNALGDQRRPAAAATSGIEPDSARRQTVPWKDREVAREKISQLRVGHGALVIARPFPAEIGDGLVVAIGRCGNLVHAMARPGWATRV